MVLQIVVIIDGPKPLYIDQLALGVFLEFVPHGKPALPVDIALDVDVILSLWQLVDPSGNVLISSGLSSHFLMLLMHRLQQFLSHVREVIEWDLWGVLDEWEHLGAFVELIGLATDLYARVFGFEF